MNEIEKSIVEQYIALLNNSFSADNQVDSKKLVRDVISRVQGLLERKDKYFCFPDIDHHISCIIEPNF